MISPVKLIKGLKKILFKSVLVPNKHGKLTHNAFEQDSGSLKKP